MNNFRQKSKTIDFLLENPHDSEKRVAYLGVNPKPEHAKHVIGKLLEFGDKGIDGFDSAIALFSILRGFSEHEELPKFSKGLFLPQDVMYRPFTVCEKRENDTEHSDHGYINGFNYGLHVLPKTMKDISIEFLTIDEKVKLIAESSNSGRALIAQSVTKEKEMSFDYGYFGVFPGNVGRITAYLVLPKPEAISIVAEAAISDSLV